MTHGHENVVPLARDVLLASIAELRRDLPPEDFERIAPDLEPAHMTDDGLRLLLVVLRRHRSG